MNTRNIAAIAAFTAVAGCCCIERDKGGCNCYPDTINEGFVSLFNGVDLEGWEGATEMYGVDP